MVVVVAPGGRDRPGIAEAFEDLQCQALVTDRLWMLLGIAVLPRAAGLDGERRYAASTGPFQKNGWGGI